MLSNLSFIVSSREGRTHLDTADTFAFLDSKLDVALVTPRGGPRILNQPVVLAILCTVAHSQNSVVEIRTAPDIIKDA